MHRFSDIPSHLHLEIAARHRAEDRARALLALPPEEVKEFFAKFDRTFARVDVIKEGNFDLHNRLSKAEDEGNIELHDKLLKEWQESKKEDNPPSPTGGFDETWPEDPFGDLDDPVEF